MVQRLLSPLAWGILGVCVALVSLGSVLAQPPVRCERVVSLAPSVSQVLTHLGLERQIVGVTRFDELAKRKDVSSVGGLFDTNLEVIVASQPTVVFGLSEYRPILDKLSALGIASAAFDHRRVDGILNSISSIGEICDKQAEAAVLRADREKLQREVERRAEPIVRQLKNKSVLVLIGGLEGEQLSRSLYVSGSDGFFFDLLLGLGFESAYRGLTTSGSTFSWEGVRSLEPFAIIHILPESGAAPPSAEQLTLWWRSVGLDRVAEQGRIYALSDPALLIPGPNFPEAQEILAKTLLQGL